MKGSTGSIVRPTQAQSQSTIGTNAAELVGTPSFELARLNACDSKISDLHLSQQDSMVNYYGHIGDWKASITMRQTAQSSKLSLDNYQPHPLKFDVFEDCKGDDIFREDFKSCEWNEEPMQTEKQMPAAAAPSVF